MLKLSCPMHGATALLPTKFLSLPRLHEYQQGRIGEQGEEEGQRGEERSRVDRIYFSAAFFFACFHLENDTVLLFILPITAVKHCKNEGKPRPLPHSLLPITLPASSPLPSFLFLLSLPLALSIPLLPSVFIPLAPAPLLLPLLLLLLSYSSSPPHLSAVHQESWSQCRYRSGRCPLLTW